MEAKASPCYEMQIKILNMHCTVQTQGQQSEIDVKKSNTKCRITHLKKDSFVAKYGCSKLRCAFVACLVN